MASHPKKAKKDKLDVKEQTKNEEGSLCERVNCPTDQLTCVLEACNGCINRRKEDTTNHPWTHLSHGEHVCIACLEFYSKSQGIGNDEFYQWKKVWTANGKSEASIGTFISDQILSFWAQCMRCNKWREMGRFFHLTRELAENFICTTSCDEPEDERVEAAKQPQWINSLMYPPYLTQSPAAPFLKSYYPDAVGMSASESTSQESGGDNFTRPFHESTSNMHALAVRPDVMDYDETLEFREFAAAQQMYLCLRNLVIACWSRNSMEWLTLDKCRHRIICRGLVRVRCVQDLERVIQFLTNKGVINCGIISSPPPSVFATKNVKDVVIIGAGMAGLSAAQHLYKQGIKTTILEVKERLGGRIHTCRLSNGSLLSLGPDIITGSINNPIALMARQAKLVVQEFPVSTIFILNKSNRPVGADNLRRAENRYLEVLDLMYEWAINTRYSKEPDVSLAAKAADFYKELEDNEEDRLSEEERLIYDIHMKNLAITLGADLKQVSARNWNSYEEYPQFSGPSFIVKQGLGALTMKMAAGLSIEYKKEVVAVEYEGEKIHVVCSDGSNYVCDKVICTASLSVYQRDLINFDPQLHRTKLNAMKQLKCGCTEKVVMHFKKKFWATKVHGARVFTSLNLLGEEESAAAVHMLYDMSSNAGHMLAMYFIEEQPLKTILGPEEREKYLEKVCMEAIKKMFPNAPEPLSVSISKWCYDNHTGMSRTYLPVSSSADVYTDISEPVDNKIFFAGEAAMPSHPNTVAGAYLSGVQQAIKVLESSVSAE